MWHRWQPKFSNLHIAREARGFECNPRNPHRSLRGFKRNLRTKACFVYQPARRNADVRAPCLASQ